LLSNTDVSKTSSGWTCRPLTVDELLQQGERLVTDVIRVLRWLEL